MRRRAVYTGLAVLLVASWATAQSNPYLPVAGAQIPSVLSGDSGQKMRVAAFLLQRHPVTNAEFLAFVLGHPQWRRGQVSPLFADAEYLSHWSTPTALGAAVPARQPVTRVSWFAASAYCEAQGARLPAWQEWELAAAADGRRRDARADPAWRQRILDWYARPAGGLAAVEQSAPDIYGLYDLHGLIWEWVQDFNALIADSSIGQFCGSGALTLQQKENYAVLMRVAMLSSLRGADTGRTLGFRCARDGEIAQP